MHMAMMNGTKKSVESTVKGNEEKLDYLSPLEDEEEKYYSVPSTLLSIGVK